MEDVDDIDFDDDDDEDDVETVVFDDEVEEDDFDDDDGEDVSFADNVEDVDFTVLPPIELDVFDEEAETENAESAHEQAELIRDGKFEHFDE